MGWGWGWTGNCGCCDSGPCHPIGLATDDFTSVNPRWFFLEEFSTGGDADVSISTSKPGMYFRAQTTGSSSSLVSGRCCHVAPEDLSSVFARYKSTILVDFNAISVGSGGISLIQTAGLSFGASTVGIPPIGNNPIGGGIRAEYRTSESGFYRYVLIRPGTTNLVDTTVPQPGDMIDIYTELLSHISGNNYSAYVEWKVNNTVLHDGTFTLTVQNGIPQVTSYQSLALSDLSGASEVSDAECYVQDWETEVGIPP